MQVQRFDPFSVLARMDREFDELVRRGWGAGRAAAGPAMAGFVLGIVAVVLGVVATISALASFTQS